MFAWLNRKDRPHTGRRRKDDLAALALLTGINGYLWTAVSEGECCCCGHDWIVGEVIGNVTQAYERLDDGTVRRSPATRLACGVCVEKQRVQGDLSIAWAQDAGLLP